MRRIRLAGTGMMLASEVSNARSSLRAFGFLPWVVMTGSHHPGLRAIGDHAHHIQEQAPANREGVQLVLLRQVAGADMGRCVGTLLLELVKFRGKGVGGSLKAGGGVLVVFLQSLGETIVGRCQAAAHPPDGRFEGTAHGVHHLRVGVKRLQVMGGQRVEVELLAQVLEEVLLRPAREHGAGDLHQGHLWVGGDHWHLATVGETAPDLCGP